MKAVAKILTDAADLIDEHGWVQGAARDIDGHNASSACGAAMAASSGWGEFDAVLDAIRSQTGTPYTPDWNDAVGRTQAEVVAMLRNAAAGQATA
jgi:hypothetical protein